MITIHQLSMTYGKKLLFANVDLILNTNQRYALVGANGTGKSTLLKLISNEEHPDEGQILTPKKASVGTLKQDQFHYENTRIIDVVLQGKPALWKAWQEKETLLAQEIWTEAHGYRLGALEEIIAHQHGYTAMTLAELMLLGLGIGPQYFEAPLKTLSGGYKLRVLLAKTLFQQPDVLLLDEPTNHLDIVSIRWLEQYLKNEFKGLLVFISHDVSFINNLATQIIDIDYGEIRVYSSPYHRFLSEKQLIETQKLAAQKSIQEKIDAMQGFVDRFKASATRAKQAQSRVKMIEKLELPDLKHSSRIPPHFHFKPSRPSGKTVLKVTHLKKSFADQILFSKITFQMNRGEKIALLGTNGSGKSTLLKILLNQAPAAPPDEGTFEWGHETHIAYVSQDQHDLLKGSITVLDWLSHEASGVSSADLRKKLGQALFTQETVNKNILHLSGGEAARLLLARAMCLPANVLIFDEPTNHLDLESIEQLASALAHYQGTVFLVSHHREFIQKTANRILYLNHQKLIDFTGDYASFEQKHALILND
jgi:ATPase subunit of ABC transporter with duplicated ATPase domains